VAIKPLSNTILIGANSNVWLATAVLVTANTVATTLTLANTANAHSSDSGQHGIYPGSNSTNHRVTVHLSPSSMTIIRKRPQDVVSAPTGVYASKVAEGS